uniref:Scarecrow-like protein 1 n=1 Tax=Kalanchoe fedtschenkoi TaxID=63787 RepID=A0A7N0UCH7_KALFE
MSLVRRVEPSGTSRASRNIYSVADKQRLKQTNRSSSSNSFETNYLLDSPMEAQPAIVGASGNELQISSASYPLKIAATSAATQNNFASEYMENEISDSAEFDAETMRLKLQELEALLCDNNFEGCDIDQDMELDGGWDNSICNDLLQESPKESTSSSLSIISSDKELSPAPFRTPKQLLIHCASIIAEGKLREASAMINELRQLVSIQGDPHERIAAYMVEGLAARMAESGQCLYKALKCKEPPTTDRLAAMQILFEVCPCFKFGYMAANGVIMEAIRDEKRVHIIDFDINQGNQYITLIQTLASRKGRRPHLRLTGVDDPESVQRSVGGLKIIGLRLEQLAEALELPFEFHAVASATSDVTPDMLDHRPDEVLIVNFAFQLHHMPDESVSTVNQRDQLLRKIKGLHPKLVTVVEQDVNTNTSPFFPRFIEAYNYYSAVFESLDATLARDSQDRINVERQCLARDIVNIVACEGEERIERYEVAGKWRARMMMAGFTSLPVSQSVQESIRNLIRKYCDRYKMKEDLGALLFGWEDKNLIVASAWR